MLLDNINLPADLRSLPLESLPEVADELRNEILKTVSTVGGHLSSNLGSVELTVALHYVYDTPTDRLVWDVGHQTYAHKMLTGRREQFMSLRKKAGLSGFPCRTESDYDSFGTAHASTSLSAALGMAVANQQSGQSRRVAAIIGDGALSGGMAFEAMNNVGIQKDINLLVVLNDNEMSISPAVGAINNYLGRVLASRFYGSIQSGGRKMLSGMPGMQQLARRAHEHLKGMVLPGTMFEEFGFNYVGPIDGHDVILLVKTLRGLRDSLIPQFLHVVTVKGKGFEKAENDPVLYHGVSAFEPSRGIAPMKVEKSQNAQPAYAEVFGDWLLYTAARDERLVGITPAMREGSGMNNFASAYPKRYFDVGIAEQHAITFAAGLACENYKPVVAIYSTFLQRAYDQLIHDVALQKLPVMFAVDRGGLVGADGATHHGAFDLSYLRCIPNMTVMTPADENLAWKMFNTAYAQQTPSVVRYPRGSGTGAAVQKNAETLPIGKGEICREGGRIALLVFGAPLAAALVVADKLNATVADMRFVKPLDEALVAKLAKTHQWLVSIEENVIAGGAGSAVGEYLQKIKDAPPLLQLGLPDEFVSHGAPSQLIADCGLDAAGIEQQIRAGIGE